jgi:hypothetical protein
MKKYIETYDRHQIYQRLRNGKHRYYYYNNLGMITKEKNLQTLKNIIKDRVNHVNPKNKKHKSLFGKMSNYFQHLKGSKK